MWNTKPRGTSRDGDGGSSMATANSGTGYPTRARTSGRPALSASRNDANHRVMGAPRLPALGGPEMPSSRRCSPRINNMAPWSSDKQQKEVVEVARVGMSKMFSDNASNSSTSRSPSRSSSTTASSNEGAKEHISGTGSVSSLSKKRKRMTAKSYRALFKPSTKANSTVVVTSDRVGKENTSSGNVAESNTGMLCEFGGLIGKDKKHSSDTTCKVSRSPVSGLQETPQTRVDKSTAPLSEVQQHKSTDTCPRNKVAESRLAVEGRDRPAGHARQNSFSSLQSAPISPIHYEEPKSGLGDGESLGVQKEVLASSQFKVTPSDEMEGNSNICIACGTPGDLKSCDGKGCKRSYHISCLDHWLEYLSPGIWFCSVCTEKRLLFGIHSVADGIESVWNVKEGMQNGKQYLVKYKNLAHVHNRWVPEGVISDTPGGHDLLSLFNKRDQEKRKWKKEWTEPHRLLRKRLLMLPKEANDFFCSIGANIEHCNVEWLVKWRDLGYEQATWELETSCFLRTPQADELKRKYETRHKAAKQSSIPIETKVKQKTYQKLQRLPDEWPPGFDNDHLFSINQLLEFWYKSHSAVLVDDKEYVIKAILFMLTVLADVCQPFLIVTTPASLSAWEIQFNYLAPFINVVVYDGQKDTLKLIQDLEFYENRSCMMLQVLLSHPDAILEDVETIERIHWEAVIVDCYQNSALKYLKQLKKLSADFRMVLLGSPIKDNLPEYMDLLAFLNSEEKDNSDYDDADDALLMLKARFRHHIAYECKTDSSKFLEYWVPSYISQAQLEIYCSILLAKSSVLQSQMKTDSDGALNDIYLSLKKCCDHPYLVDEFVRSSLSNNSETENIDMVVHASGKLLLLEKILKEIKKKRLRVILLFQSDRAGGNTMGNILEGVMHHRFGPESYERVEYGAVLSRKQAAVDKFNNKTNGRFVFLIENRACLPSIKLSSVDAVIIYGTDDNPLNDLKVLQKIKIESQFEHVSIFRLYTPFTVEEKSLVLAKQGILIGNGIQGLRTSFKHSLLRWGASFLFTRLDEVQQDNHASKSSEMETHFIDQVIVEFSTKLSTNVEDSTEVHKRSISKANMSGELYSRNITLMGEKEGISVLEEDPAKFWLNLLDGRSPQVSYMSDPLQSRVRKSQTMDEVKAPAEEIDEARKKRTKIGETMGSSSKVLSDSSNDDALPEICTTSGPALQPVDDTQQKLGSESLMSTPKNLHVQLKQELSKLIKVLQLPDNVRLLVEQFFDYLLNNHLVAKEPNNIWHAFNIALCWRVASLLNFKVDHRELLALAEKRLKYECNEELARLAYNRLRTLKKKIPQKAGAAGSNCQSTSVEKTNPSQQETSNIFKNDHMFPKQRMDLHDNFMNGALQDHGQKKNGALQEGSCAAAQMVSEEQELIAVPGTHIECHLSTDDDIVEKRINLIDTVFSLRENRIVGKQQSQISELDTYSENKITRLKTVCNLVLEHIRRSQVNVETRNDTIKRTVQWFTMFMFAFLEHMKLQYSKLEALQTNTWAEERQLKEKLRQEAKSGQLDHTFDQRIDLPDSNFVMEEFIHLKEQNSNSHVGGSPVSDCQQLCHDRLKMSITLVRNVVLSEPISSRAVRNGSVESVMVAGQTASEVVDFPENNIRYSPDGIGLQKASCSPSTMPSNDDSINQESSASEYTSTENVERDNANPSTLLGGATSHVMGVDANNDVTVAADHTNLESMMLASTQSLMIFSVSKEVATRSSLSNLPVSQTVETLQHPPAEAELTENLGATAWDVQPDMQTTTSTLNSPFEKMCPDDNNRTVHQPDTATGPLQEGATSCHLASVDASAGVTAEVDDTAAADLLDSETQSYTAAHNPAALVVAREVETQTDQSSMLELQSTSLPPKQSSVPSRHPSAEAEPASILSMETAQDMQPEMQQSASVLETSLQRMHPDDGSQAKHQLETAPDLSHRGGTSDQLGDARERVDTVCAVRVHLESPTVVTPQSLAICPVLREVGTQGNISNMPSQQGTDLSAQQNLAPPPLPPAEAERTGLLITQPAGNFQPDMQSSTSLLDISLESNNRSQTDYQSDRAVQEGATTQQHLVDARVVVDDSVAEEPSHSESPSYIVHETAALAVSTEVETQTCPSSIPAQQNTSQPAQQSPATSRHSTASPVDIEATQEFQPEMQPSTSGQNQSTEVEQEGMSSSLAVQDLQPGIQPPNSVQDQYPGAEREGMSSISVAEDLQPVMQPSTPVPDQLAEANQEGMLSAAVARNLQPETQRSTSTQDAQFERTDLSGISVPQSITAYQSVVPSWDLHTGVEPTGALCMETAHERQSELQPSGSMQERSAETGVGTSCTTAACDLQPQLEPSSAMQPVPLERIRCEDRNQIGVQSNSAPSPEQPTQPLQVAPIVFNMQRVSDEPLKNELERLKHTSNILSKAHEQKRKQLLMEYNQEMEKLKKKYYSLIQKEDSSYAQKEAELDTIYRKVSINQSLAENFRGKFLLSAAAQGGSMRPTMGQSIQSPQPPSARILAEQVTASPVSLSSAARPQVLHSSGLHVQPSLVVQPSSSQATQAESILPGNIYRAISSPFSTMPMPHGSYRAAGAQSYAPTPQLQQLRMPSPYAMSRASQQQLPVNPGVTPLRQLVPAIMENSAPTNPHAGFPLTSMAPNSVHQTMQTISSASNSHPAIPASSLLSGPLPEFMANFVLPSSSNPSLTAPQSLNMGVHSTSGPLNAAAGSQHAGAQISGVNPSGSASASLNTWLTARLGLTSEPRGTISSTEVVCLSDDES